jgi:hypothetical protein
MRTTLRNARPTVAQLVKLLRERFVVRDDTFGIIPAWNRPARARTSDHMALLTAHVAGESAPRAKVVMEFRKKTQASAGHFRVGAYQLDAESRCKWLCIDFDAGEDHACCLQDPLEAALKTAETFLQYGIAPHLERSGGGKGWHVWVFFSEPVDAAIARDLAMRAVPRDARLTKEHETYGWFAKPENGAGIEVFPKQVKVDADGFGNLVWLPFWCGAAEGGNMFYSFDEVDASGQVQTNPYWPSDFDDVDAITADLALAEMRAVEYENKPRDQKRISPQQWEEWRDAARDRLDVNKIYGQWLTGKRSSASRGWLECRDPWSPTGDQTVSAGVSDGTGKAVRGTFHSFISGNTMTVFKFMTERGIARDFAEACRMVADFSGVELPEGVSSMLAEGHNPESIGDEPAIAAGSSTPSADRLTIQINLRQPDEVLADAWRAIHSANLRDPRAPFLMKRSGILVRVQMESAVHTIGQVPTIQGANTAVVHGYLIRNANWMRKEDKELYHSAPPKFLSEDMLAFIPEAVPPLAMIATTPVFTREGVLVDEPGYHAASAIYYSPAEGLDNMPPVPREPSSQQVDDAVQLLFDELLVDFPFITEADRAHAIACMVLPAARNLIQGPTPMHLIEAPSAGSGKGLLTAVIGIAATGKNPETRTLASDDAEARKLITAELDKGRQIVVLDNATEKRVIDCPPLASVLTSETWSDRRLQETQMIDLPNRACWIFTGNNPRLSRELTRRCVRIAIDPQTDQPWRRSAEGFHHSHLLSWAFEHRASLVHAVLTIVSNWIARGRPLFIHARLGSFESWSAVIGGILQAANVPHFLGNLADMYETADEESAEWREFVIQWWKAYRGRPLKMGELCTLAIKLGLMYSVRGDGNPQSQAIKLGKGISRMKNRVFDGRRIIIDRDIRSKAQLASLEVMPGYDPASFDDPDDEPYSDRQHDAANDRDEIEELSDLVDQAAATASRAVGGTTRQTIETTAIDGFIENPDELTFD